MLYSALLDEFEDDKDLAPFLDAAKNQLHTYYKTHYANTNNMAPRPSPSNQSSQTPSTVDGSPQKNFTVRGHPFRPLSVKFRCHTPLSDVGPAPHHIAHTTDFTALRRTYVYTMYVPMFLDLAYV
jgi:hypothetical protein